MSAQIKVSLDGGVTWNDAPAGVRVHVTADGQDESFQFNFTHEGLIVDEFSAGGELAFEATNCLLFEDFSNLTRVD